MRRELGITNYELRIMEMTGSKNHESRSKNKMMHEFVIPGLTRNPRNNIYSLDSGSSPE